MRTLELTRGGLLATLGIFVVVAVCIRLGFWQLERREERLARNAAIAERLEADPVSLDRAPPDTAGLAYRRAVLRGRWDGERSLVLAGRSRMGAPGAYVLTPLRVGERSVLVNRGWAPAPDAATVDPAVLRAGGPATVAGVLMPFPAVETGGTGAAGFRTTWYRFDGDAMRRQYPYEVAPLYLVAAAPESSTPPGAAGAAGMRWPMPLEPPALDAGPHLSYAVQWFSFALVFLVGWAALVARRARREHPGGAEATSA